MRIKWWGHSCFLIEKDNLKVITDPYDESLPYSKITDQPDFVTVSHSHFDHNAVQNLTGNFEVIDSASGFKSDQIEVEAIKSYHDDNQGSERGENLIYLIKLGNETICHLGDLGHLLAKDVIAKLAGVNILLIPVGGYYTIDAEQAFSLIKKIKPDLVIPMHYKTDILDFPITGVEKFTDKFEAKQIEKLAQADFETTKFSNKKVIIPDYVKK